MSYISEQNQNIHIQNSIRKAEDELFNAIQNIIDNKVLSSELEESKFRELLRVSQITESPEVIKNFLRYQLGRDSKWGRGKDSLAARIIQDIDTTIQELAKKIALENKTDNFNSIWLDLMRRYFGVGVNYLSFINSSDLHQIEESISRLSHQEQLWLVERIIHNMKVISLRDISNILPESIEQQLINMANDPAIQAEIIAINQEFVNYEM
ncbi:MAG: hypothetical protein KA716_32395 [Gloeotrichia echinulata DEX184]|jgi:hypothetical protein